MPSLPTSLALTSIADGALLVAADHRNNYAAVQVAVNSLITTLGGGATGQFLAGNGTTLSWLQPPGTELTNDEFTVSVATAVAENAAGIIKTATAVTFDGATAACVEFYVPSVNVSTPTAGDLVGVNLFLDGTDIGRIYVVEMLSAAVGQIFGVYAKVRLPGSVLTAGSRTLSARGWRTGTSSPQWTVGAGGVAIPRPGYIRITKA